jgi:hypothetical protein
MFSRQMWASLLGSYSQLEHCSFLSICIYQATQTLSLLSRKFTSMQSEYKFHKPWQVILVFWPSFPRCTITLSHSVRLSDEMVESCFITSHNVIALGSTLFKKCDDTPSSLSCTDPRTSWEINGNKLSRKPCDVISKTILSWDLCCKKVKFLHTVFSCWPHCG